MASYLHYGLKLFLMKYFYSHPEVSAPRYIDFHMKTRPEKGVTVGCIFHILNLVVVCYISNQHRSVFTFYRKPYSSLSSMLSETLPITLEDLLLFNRNKSFLGEHKVITPKQQFLGIISCFFMYLKWPWLLSFFAKML